MKKIITKEEFEKFKDKILLIVQLPLYPFIYLFLKEMIKTKKGRFFLFIRTNHFVPFKRVMFFALDKIFVKEIKNYSLPSYNSDYPGYVMDYKYLIATKYFNDKIFNTNYSYALGNILDIVNKNGNEIKAIVDLGCGAGMLTRIIADKYKNIKAVGLDIRPDTMECNKILEPSIEWDLVSNLDFYINKYGKEHIIFVCNGVVNFMTQQEIENTLSKNIKYITWFYYTPTADPVSASKSDKLILSIEKSDTNYNIAAFSRKFNYSFNFDFFQKSNGEGNFVYGISELKK